MWSVRSETGRLTDALVCSPDHYRWIPANAIARRTIAEGGRADPRGLQAQHRELVAALAEGGVRVVSAAASRDLNAALRAEGLAVLDPELSLFTAGGGGPHCLTCPLARDEPVG